MADIEHYLRDHDSNVAEATAAAHRSANRTKPDALSAHAG